MCTYEIISGIDLWLVSRCLWSPGWRPGEQAKATARCYQHSRQQCVLIWGLCGKCLLERREFDCGYIGRKNESEELLEWKDDFYLDSGRTNSDIRGNFRRIKGESTLTTLCCYVLCSCFYWDAVRSIFSGEYLCSNTTLFELSVTWNLTQQSWTLMFTLLFINTFLYKLKHWLSAGQVHAHYFEDGNVQLQTNKKVEPTAITYDSDAELVEAVVKKIKVCVNIVYILFYACSM